MQKNGISLVETLIALFIVTLFFSSLGGFISHLSRSIDYLKNKIDASLIADNVFQTYRLHLISLSEKNVIEGETTIYKWILKSIVDKKIEITIFLKEKHTRILSLTGDLNE